MRTFFLLVILLSLSACDNKPSLSDAATSIDPPRPLMDMVLVDINGEPMPANLLRNHWTYVILADADCDETCMQYIEFTRAVVNEKQGEQAMQRLLVLGYSIDKAFGKKLQEDNPDMKIAILTRPIWAIFTVNFLQVATEVGGAPLYLVDPRAFLVAAYDDFVEAKDLVNDLTVLNGSLAE
jgi:hypothetical protein